jgi:hypothetical protein
LKLVTWFIFRSRFTIFKCAKIIGKREHVITVQHDRAHIFGIDIGDIPTDAVVLIENIEYGKFNFRLPLFQEFLGQTHIPKKEILIKSLG